MAKPRVFVTRRIPAEGLELLERECEVDVWDQRLPPDRSVLLERIAGCAGAITLLTEKIDGAFFDAAGPSLKVVSNFAVGFNNIDVDAATARGIRVGNTPGVLTDATADIAVALMLAAGRHLRRGIQAVVNGQWQTWEPLGLIGCDFGGKTVGIIGMGRIGRAVARRLHFGWGMQVLYTARSRKEDAEREVGARLVSQEELLRDSDVVSLHCDLNESTLRLIDAAALARMKSTAILVNTGRGELVDQRALYEALSSGQIFAAGLDVTTPEPLPSSDPLCSLDNCVIVPHIGSATFSSRGGMAEIAARNVLAGIRGERLPHAVN